MVNPVDLAVGAGNFRSVLPDFRAARHVSSVPILFSNSGSGCQAFQRSSLPGPLFSPR